jgi:hypothetical protein
MVTSVCYLAITAIVLSAGVVGLALVSFSMLVLMQSVMLAVYLSRQEQREIERDKIHERLFMRIATQIEHDTKERPKG